MIREIRYAWRHLSRARGFSFVAIVTLALAGGGTGALVSLLQAIVLRPLNVPEPERLAIVTTANDKGLQGFISLPAIEDLRRAQDVFTGLCGSISGTGATVEVNGVIQRRDARLRHGRLHADARRAAAPGPPDWRAGIRARRARRRHRRALLAAGAGPRSVDRRQDPARRSDTADDHRRRIVRHRHVDRHQSGARRHRSSQPDGTPAPDAVGAPRLRADRTPAARRDARGGASQARRCCGPTSTRTPSPAPM